MQRQLDLFAAGTRPSFDSDFQGAERSALAGGAWIDVVRGWVRGHDALFDELEQDLAWRRETMEMYDREVEIPRLLASIDVHARSPLVEDMRVALSKRYGEEFVRTTAALYRGGDDSVAMHGDRVARTMVSALVATVSLGAPRKFVMKPTEGGETVSMDLGRGDLLVMGGTCQRTWRHGIPKVAAASPRIALMFRPIWAASY